MFRTGLSGPLAQRHDATLSGQGSTLMVLSHGLGTDQHVWSRIRPTLERHYQVLSYNLPGAGPWVPDDFDAARYQDISAYADDLLALLDELGVAHCPIYVGHSVSGAVGLLAAAAQPQRFGQLCLINASARYLNDADYQGGFTQADLDGLYAAIRGNYEAWVAGFSQIVIDASVPGAVDEFARGFLAMRPDITLSAARTIFQSDIRHVLPHVSHPVLLIHNANDPAVPPQAAEFLRQGLVNSQLTWIPAAGHLPHVTSPEAVLAALQHVLGWASA